MTRTVGVVTSSRSERHLCEALVKEMNSGKYDLKAKLIDIRSASYEEEVGDFSEFQNFDITILPADRIEMGQFAYSLFRRNIIFCHFLCGSISYSNCHDDTVRWLITLMSNFVFAESPEARTNVLKIGYPEDRVTITGTSHFDGITAYDIEANKPANAPKEPYDLILFNPETQREGDICCQYSYKDYVKSPNYIMVAPNEDDPQHTGSIPRLEFLNLLKHCTNFISNSSATLYEAPYLNKFYGAKINVIKPSQRNAERTAIPPEYCRGASPIIARWCQEVDIEWLKTPKRLFYKEDRSLAGLPK